MQEVSGRLRCLQELLGERRTVVRRLALVGQDGDAAVGVQAAYAVDGRSGGEPSAHDQVIETLQSRVLSELSRV